jgi:hypothetical protein
MIYLSRGLQERRRSLRLLTLAMMAPDPMFWGICQYRHYSVPSASKLRES